MNLITPPHAPDLERAVLGALLLDKTAFDTVHGLLDEGVFYDDRHTVIYHHIKKLSLQYQPIDILTVTDSINKANELEDAGGVGYITALTRELVSTANLEAHSRIILQKYINRRLIQIYREAEYSAQTDSDCFENIDETAAKISKLESDVAREGAIDMGEAAFRFLEMSGKSTTSGKITGVPSGFEDIDKHTFGWQNTDLIILAARPSVGKTALALNLAYNAATFGTPTLFMSLEMSRHQLLQRLISMAAELNLETVRSMNMTSEVYQKQFIAQGIRKLEKLPLYIDDAATMSWQYVRAQLRNLKRKHGIKLVFIDYLQLMDDVIEKGQSRNREQQISNISKNLKRTAKELEIPLIALSQLNRQSEMRANKEPMLADLRESGAIEQDADVVMFIYRPDYYKSYGNQDRQGETYVKFSKNRNGAIGTAKIIARLQIQKFFGEHDMNLARFEYRQNNEGRPYIEEKEEKFIENKDNNTFNR